MMRFHGPRKVEVAGGRKLRAGKEGEEDRGPFELGEIGDCLAHVVPVENVEHTVLSRTDHEIHARWHNWCAGSEILVLVRPGSCAILERREPVHRCQLSTAWGSSEV